jgi:hypothetical protein
MTDRVKRGIRIAATFAIPAAILFVSLGNHVHGLSHTT